MKRLLLFAISFIVCASVFAQDPTFHYDYFFNSRSNPENTALKIKEYLCDIMAFVATEDGDCFKAELGAFITSRDSVSKTVYSCICTVRYNLNGRKARFNVDFSDFKKNTVLCDKSDAETNEILTVEKIPVETSKRLDFIGDNLVDHIRDYVNSGDKALTPEFGIPIWWYLSYIVGEDTVLYYTVLKSDKELSSDRLFTIVEKYFSFDYLDGKATVEEVDKDNLIISGKASFANVFIDSYNDAPIRYSFPHKFVVQCRDGRIRYAITLSEIDCIIGWQTIPGKIVWNLPFGQADVASVKDAILYVEEIIFYEFAKLKKVIEKNDVSLDTSDNW